MGNKPALRNGDSLRIMRFFADPRNRPKPKMQDARLILFWLALLACSSGFVGCNTTRRPTVQEDPGPPVNGGTLKLVGGSDIDHLAPTSGYGNNTILLSNNSRNSHRDFRDELQSSDTANRAGNPYTTTHCAAESSRDPRARTRSRRGRDASRCNHRRDILEDDHRLF